MNKVENTSIRNDRELIEEILALTRVTARRTVNNKEINSKQKYKSEIFEKLVADFIFGN